jgi:hypothetical protein
VALTRMSAVGAHSQAWQKIESSYRGFAALGLGF